jgi:hypothetical protein
LALRVRQVDKGTIRSYRLFDGDRFHGSAPSRKRRLILSSSACHRRWCCFTTPADGHKASLRINLDIYEMLMRLNNGYRPSIEEQEGFY